MLKENIKKLLADMKTSDNESVINHILKSIEKISEEDLILTLDKYNVTEQNIEQFLRNRIEKQIEKEKTHTELHLLTKYLVMEEQGMHYICTLSLKI